MTSKFFKTYFVTICIIFLMLIFLNAPAECQGFEIDIAISPNTLNLQSQGSVVTVHTTIPYGDVAYESVFLNGIAISSWKADNKGFFVAKFSMSEVKALADEGCLIVPGDNELTLAGYTTKEKEFLGSDIITVIEGNSVGKR